MLSSLVDLKPNISAMVDSTMAVSTRGASIILVELTTVDSWMKQSVIISS